MSRRDIAAATPDPPGRWHQPELPAGTVGVPLRECTGEPSMLT